MKSFNIGIQLYSLKAQIAEFGLDAVLSTLQSIGVEKVELAGYYGLSPAELRAKLNSHGISAVAAHIKLESIITDMEYIEALGISKVYIPISKLYTFSEEERADYYARAREVSAILAARGLVFGYHNHAVEFSEGRDLVWEAMGQVPGLTSELDIFWATVAERDPLKVIEKYGNRLSALHIRELGSVTDGDNKDVLPHAIVGEGRSKCRESIRAAMELGVDTFILEVGAYPCDYVEYISKSIANIKKFVEENLK